MDDHRSICRRSLLVLVVLTAISASGNCDNEVELLLGLKNSLDQRGVLSSWNTSSSGDFCKWTGVQCSQGQLLGIGLDSTKLNGSVSAFAPLSKFLKNLSLANNELSGQLDDLYDKTSPGSCSLQFINLSRNKISGSFPTGLFNICSSLTNLDLSSNSLSGELQPQAFTSCTMLKSINLSKNNILGGIPSQIAGSCVSLMQLDLAHNNLTTFNIGGSWTKLTKLDVSYNKVTSGPVFQNRSSFPVLDSLNFSNNNLTGDFVVVLGVSDYAAVLPSLSTLDGSFNNMSGGVPSIAAIITSMKSMDLCSNYFTLTSDICNPESSLQTLLLVNNQLSDDALKAAMNCTMLTKLDVSFNSMQGSIPEDVCKKLPSLQHFMAWANKLNGNIPRTLGTDCANLTTLLLSHNQLDGQIPGELSQCSSLEWLSLSNNRLSGSIPESLGHLRRLAFLQMSNNNFQGHIPDSIATNCCSLLWIDISSNNISGSLPLFQTNCTTKSRVNPLKTLSAGVIGFAKNTAAECKGLGGLVELQGVTQERLNQLTNCGSSRVYSSLGFNYTAFYQNRSLASPLSIDVSYNQLNGVIPSELGDLGDLVMLDLGHNHFEGAIPPSLGKLIKLSLLDLSFNKLSGSIPENLGNLTLMSSLDLSNNSLSGSIPSRGQLLTFGNESYANNSRLCGLPLEACPSSLHADQIPSQQPKTLWRQAFAPLIVVIFVGSAFLGILFCWIWWKKQQINEMRQQKLAKAEGRYLEQNSHSLSINLALFEKPLQKITFAELWRATDGFSHEFMIGSGGSGEVYKAQLGDGTVVAVKKLVKTSMHSDREFMAEMETLGKIQHQNLISLVGYCKCREEKLLVYEFMQGGSLEQILHDPILRIPSIPWSVRAQIATGAAKGLAFLHHSCIPHVIHRDMKSSNVLLDMTLQEARVSDFGMARLMCASDTYLSVTTLSGTPGYVPPEYYQSFRCTRNGDVYSFGVVLLELLTRKRPTDKDEFGDSNLVGWTKSCVSRGKSSEVLDPEVSSCNRSEMLEYLKVACNCLDDNPHRRPSMMQVVASFKELSLLDHAFQ